MRARAVALAVMMLLVPAAVEAQKAELERVLERLGTAWARGDARAITALGARAGISLEIGGETVGPLPPRQAAAVLRRLFNDRKSVSVKPGMARVVGGKPARAFGELTWVVRVDGTTIPERSTVFLAFLREDDAWKITQIRVRT